MVYNKPGSHKQLLRTQNFQILRHCLVLVLVSPFQVCRLLQRKSLAFRLALVSIPLFQKGLGTRLVYHEPMGGHSQQCHGYRLASFPDNKVVSVLDLPKTERRVWQTGWGESVQWKSILLKETSSKVFSLGFISFNKAKHYSKDSSPAVSISNKRSSKANRNAGTVNTSVLACLPDPPFSIFRASQIFGVSTITLRRLGSICYYTPTQAL